MFEELEMYAQVYYVLYTSVVGGSKARSSNVILYYRSYSAFLIFYRNVTKTENSQLNKKEILMSLYRLWVVDDRSYSSFNFNLFSLATILITSWIDTC